MTPAKREPRRWQSVFTSVRAPRLLGDVLLVLTWLIGIAIALCAAVIALLVADGSIVHLRWPGSSRLGSAVTDLVLITPPVLGFFCALNWVRRGRSGPLLEAVAWLALLLLTVVGVLLRCFLLFLGNAHLPVPIH